MLGDDDLAMNSEVGDRLLALQEKLEEAMAEVRKARDE